ncbi:hypothetical protein FB451DRAFT_428775 [Mycena latifolia]|nr:hypothetical protein FB451DRAFT_428775 [Mycena latifolia]
MANLLARFKRGRTQSLTAASALTSPGPTLPNTPAAAPAPAPIQPAVAAVQSPPLERKIHPDLDSLVANWTPPVARASDAASASGSSPPDPFPTPLRPSTRRHSIDGAVPVLPPPQAQSHLDDLPELPVPIPFTAQPQPPTRTRRLLTRLTRSPSPRTSTINVATPVPAVGWSTFGRRAHNSGGNDTRPHLTDFGELGRGSPAPSQGTSISHSQSFSPSRSASQVNLGTPSTTSQHLDDSVSGHGHGHHGQATPGSDLPSPASGFTFGSQSRVSGRTSAPASPPPPMPPLDHPAFHGMSSQSPTPLPGHLQRRDRDKERHPRSSSSLPSMHSMSRRKRARGGGGDRTKVQDIFASLSRPGSARRRASAEFATPPAEVEVVVLPLGGGHSRIGDEDDKREVPGSDLRGGDFKFDARAKRVVCPSNLIFLSLCPISRWSAHSLCAL